MTLSEQQRAAVTRTGQDVCVVAGPGSGKTRVLVERFQWLVEQGVSPLRILAITFTEKAAHEIKERLVKQFESRPGLRRQIERAYVSTLHAFCMRLLRENAIAAGLDPRFDILDERGSQAALRRSAAQALDELFAARPGDFRRLLSAWKTNDPVADILKLYETVRVSGASWEQLRGGTAPRDECAVLIEAVRAMRRASPRAASEAQQRRLDQIDEWLEKAAGLRTLPVTAAQFEILDEFQCDKRGLKAGHPIHDGVDDVKKVLLPAARAALVGRFHEAERNVLVDALGEFHRIYSAYKRSVSLLDFSDLEERAIALLKENGELREAVRETFEAVLMDELQDTNPLQWELMDLVRREGRFFAVGDINQSIFGFRHAEPRGFRAFRERVEAGGGKVDLLSRNHRSRAEILRTVDVLAGRLPGVEANPLEAGRRFHEKEEPSVEAVAAIHEDSDEGGRLEARWIARRIREMEGRLAVNVREGGDGQNWRPARFSDMAVLVRNTRAVDDLEEAFREFAVPFVMNRGRTFFEEGEVTDLIAWLRVIANPRDETALAALLRSPFHGIGDESLLRLRLGAGNLADGVSKFDAEEAREWEPADVEALVRFRGLLRDLRARRDEVSPDRLLARAMDECGYEAGILPRQRANIDKFLQLVRDWYARSPAPPQSWIDTLDALREAANEPSAPANDTPDAVQVLTIHGSKGLEFPIVFLAAMHLGVSTEKDSLLFSAESGLGMQWRDPFTGKSVSDAAHMACRRRTREREDEEADRLLYVAMTRAEEHLVLSWVERKGTAPRWPSLISELLGERVRRVEQVEGNDFPAVGAVEAREPEVLAAPAVVGQYDSTASVTALAQFRSCPRQYYLQRYLGWDGPLTAGAVAEPEELAAEDWKVGELSGTELGTAVHAILAGEVPERESAEARELAGRFLSSDLAGRVKRASRVKREFDFVFALDGVVLRGQIDLWFEEEGGGTVLVDYKTDRYDASRVEHYAVQVRLYALALEKATGRLPEEAWLYFLRPNLAVRVSLEEAVLREARELVARFREAQDQMRFPLAVGPHCYVCPFFKNLCPAAVTLQRA